MAGHDHVGFFEGKSIERLGNMRSLPKGFERSRWGEAIVEAVTRGLARDPKTVPRPARIHAAANGAAVVELLKVLLRMISESHHVAAKVIAVRPEVLGADDDDLVVGVLVALGGVVVEVVADEHGGRDYKSSRWPKLVLCGYGL